MYVRRIDIEEVGFYHKVTVGKVCVTNSKSSQDYLLLSATSAGGRPFFDVRLYCMKLSFSVILSPAVLPEATKSTFKIRDIIACWKITKL